MYRLMELTSATMEPIASYGLFHISYDLIGVLLSIFISYKLRNISIKKLNKIIFGIGIFLLVTEIYKQLFYTFYIGLGSYQWWIFPFQLCSIPIYFCLMLPFIKNKKVYNTICMFLITYNLLGGFVSFIEPSGLIHEYISLTVHAFLWHMSLIFLGVLIACNKNINKDKKYFKSSIYLYIILSLIAFIINLIFYKVSNGEINMFFVGPAVSPIIVFKTIATKCGWFINDILYISVMTFGAYLIYLLITNKKINKLLNK